MSAPGSVGERVLSPAYYSQRYLSASGPPSRMEVGDVIPSLPNQSCPSLPGSQCLSTRSNKSCPSLSNRSCPSLSNKSCPSLSNKSYPSLSTNKSCPSLSTNESCPSLSNKSCPSLSNENCLSLSNNSHLLASGLTGSMQEGHVAPPSLSNESLLLTPSSSKRGLKCGGLTSATPRRSLKCGSLTSATPRRSLKCGNLTSAIPRRSLKCGSLTLTCPESRVPLSPRALTNSGGLNLTPTLGYLVQALGLIRLMVTPGLESEVRPPRERSTPTTCRLVDPIVTVSATRLSRFWLHPPHRRALHVPLVLPEEPRVYT